MGAPCSWLLTQKRTLCVRGMENALFREPLGMECVFA